MKYIITESKLESAIIDILDEMFPVEDVNWYHPYDYDDDTGEEMTKIELSFIWVTTKMITLVLDGMIVNILIKELLPMTFVPWYQSNTHSTKN
jgi:hypothetical protein